jgi:ribosomal protein S27AE
MRVPIPLRLASSIAGTAHQGAGYLRLATRSPGRCGYIRYIADEPHRISCGACELVNFISQGFLSVGT